MKKKFDFALGLDDEDGDIDGDLNKQIDKIELRGDSHKPGRTANNF